MYLFVCLTHLFLFVNISGVVHKLCEACQAVPPLSSIPILLPLPTPSTPPPPSALGLLRCRGPSHVIQVQHIKVPLPPPLSPLSFLLPSPNPSPMQLALEPDCPHVFLSCGEDGTVFQIDLREATPRKTYVSRGCVCVCVCVCMCVRVCVHEGTYPKEDVSCKDKCCNVLW